MIRRLNDVPNVRTVFISLIRDYLTRVYMDVNVQIKKFSRIGVSFFSLKCLFDLIISNFMYLL